MSPLTDLAFVHRLALSLEMPTAKAQPICLTDLGLLVMWHGFEFGTKI